jgi:acetate kinase
VLQVACFDTAFHRTMPAAARRLPIPARFDAAGVRRYGFHGLSYEYVVGSLGAAARGRAVVAHLGSGASMAAIREGASVDTTMGFTPAGGLVMSSRSGDLDPGVLVHLLRTEEHDADDLERIVERESGLTGVSGRTGDMRELLECRGDDADAALAVDMFCTRVRMQVGAYAALLGGIDNLVFTGGIGERSAPVRTEICAGLEHLGVEIDEARNRDDAAVVSPDGASCVVRVVPTDEELVIARHAARLVGAPR